MKMSMEHYTEKGKSDVQDKLQEGTEEIKRIGEEYGEVKEQLRDLPDGLDDDLLEMIKDAEQVGKDEAMADIEDINNTVIDEAKAAADTIDGEVQSKISDNNLTLGKLEGIQSGYGRDSIERAKGAIESNTETGEELLKTLEDAITSADQDIQSVRDAL